MKGLKDQARRGFTILVAVMLLTVVVVPAFSGSAAAATGDDNHCTQTVVTKLIGNACMWAGGHDSVNESTDREKAYIQADLHAEARSEYESSEQMQTVFNNYAEDTSTLASLEARNAIATAYENNESASTADAKAQTAIQDYYSVRMVNTLEAFSKAQAQMAYAANVSHSDSRIGNNYFYPQAQDLKDSNGVSGTINQARLTGELVTKNYTLPNGSTHQYQVAQIIVKGTVDGGSVGGKLSPTIQDYEGTSGWIWYDVPSHAGTGRVQLNGLHNVRASYWNTTYDISNGHPAQVITSKQDWAAVTQKWNQQSSTVESNYAAGTASDMYTAMDNGKISPADVRGAEGQVRYLSGDSNATEERFRAALYGSLNMSQAGFNSTFTVHYDGYTEYNPNETSGGTMEYQNPVNTTYKGIVFAQEVPSGGFETGTTYNTENLNGSVMIYTENGETVTFEKGNFTINEITDPEGNQVTNVTWEQPKYDTSNTDDFIDYLNKTQQMQMELLERYSDTTSSGSTTSDDTSSGWNPTQNQMIAAFIAIVAMLGMAQRGAE